jgi:hypothetical protein
MLVILDLLIQIKWLFQRCYLSLAQILIQVMLDTDLVDNRLFLFFEAILGILDFIFLRLMLQHV